jgi:ABC-type uncharacterized transport system involved in gliding motility auxiliary subunit
VAVAVGPKAKESEKPFPGDIEEEDLEEASKPNKDEKKENRPEWRLVVFGDSDLFRSSLLENVGNPVLANNVFNWLLERERLLGIGPKRPEQARLNLTPRQLSAITWGTLLGMPLTAAVVGVVVYRRRRR